VVQEDANAVSEGPDDEREAVHVTDSPARCWPTWLPAVTDGYSKTLEIVGVGTVSRLAQRPRVRARLQPPGSCQGSAGVQLPGAEPDPFRREWIDKSRSARSPPLSASAQPDPYKGKGRAFQGEVIRRKRSKAGK